MNSSDFFKLIDKDYRSGILEAFESGEVFCVHNLNKALNEVDQISFLKSYQDLIANWSLEADVHLESSRDEHTTLTVPSSTEADSHFKKGRSLLFNDVNRLAPRLELYLESLRDNLKLSRHTYSRALIYATPASGGNAAHFDQNINLVLQLSGEKTWWTAPNSSIMNPVHRHVIGQSVDPELDTYAESKMPTSFPEKNSTKHHLKAGSLLLVPPGVWHKTRAQTDAVSLNFTFSPPTWSDLITIALRGRLMQSKLWRETAKNFDSPDQLDKFDFLIQHLASDISTWSAEELIEALEQQ